MCILFQISVESSKCWQERVLGRSGQSNVLLGRLYGIRKEALAFLSRLFARSRLSLCLSDIEYRLRYVALAHLVILHLQAKCRGSGYLRARLIFANRVLRVQVLKELLRIIINCTCLMLTHRTLMGQLEDIQVILELVSCRIELDWLRFWQPVLICLALYLAEI